MRPVITFFGLVVHVRCFRFAFLAGEKSGVWSLFFRIKKFKQIAYIKDELILHEFIGCASSAPMRATYDASARLSLPIHDGRSSYDRF